RHVQALRRAEQHVDAADLELGFEQLELAAEELRLAHEALGEITGKLSADDLLGKIFSSFCIGK
ncbi:MAG: tRNA uridine-5-carboxymethylaminomethyl(34) synthesis GTPase MnmE, partial [Xanthomonas perforans]|nr:tRNA uridine-5-carboxymethylaminomethyl(34) synthesis GTPase MnmE [Xanthomonas perforans]